MSFLSFLKAIGKDFLKGLEWALKYALSGEALAGVLFPASVAAIKGAVSVATLLQNCVVMAEQKYAAAGVQNGTGAQKLAEVLSLSKDAVTQLLADPTISAELTKAGIVVDESYISNLVNAVVAVLNVQTPPPAAA